MYFRSTCNTVCRTSSTRDGSAASDLLSNFSNLGNVFTVLCQVIRKFVAESLVVNRLCCKYIILTTISPHSAGVEKQIIQVIHKCYKYFQVCRMTFVNTFRRMNGLYIVRWRLRILSNSFFENVSITSKQSIYSDISQRKHTLTWLDIHSELLQYLSSGQHIVSAIPM